MGTQEEFDAKVEAIQATLNQTTEGLTAVTNQIASEGQQIRDFIEQNSGSGIDFSALDGVAVRLNQVNESINAANTGIAGIFEPPAPAATDQVPADPEPVADPEG